MKNYKTIQVDQATGKLVAQVICEEIKKSRDKNKKIYDKAKKSEQLYAQMTDYAAQGKVCDNPWDGAADYFIPITEWTVDAVWARVVQTLLTSEPYMTATGVSNAERVTDFVDQVFRDKVKLYENINFFFKQMLKIPFAVLKYDWCQKLEPKISKEMAAVYAGPNGEREYVLPGDPQSQARAAELLTNGYVQQPQQEEVWVRQDVELENQPKLKYVRFDDYVWSPDAKRDVRLYWEGDRFWLTANEISEYAKQERFRKEAADAVIKGMDITGKEGKEKAVAARSTLNECYHWFGRLPFNQQFQVDFESEDAIEQEVYCVVATKDEELLQIQTWPYSRNPYPDRVYIRGEFEETEDFEGRSLVDKLYMTQKELNTFFNTILNNAWLSMQKIFVKKKSLQGSDWDEPEVYPGAMWEEYQTGDIRVLEVGDVKAIGLELQKLFLDFAERISNVSIYQVGAARREGGNKTLGEVQATISEANTGMDKFIRNCHNILIKICKWTVSYYKERMPADIPRKIRGLQGEMVYPTQDNQDLFDQMGVPQYWEDRDLDGDPDFIWNGTLLSASKEWKLALANDLQDRYLNQPMVSGNLASTWEILKMGLEARGIRDWQKILPPKEAVLQEMQRMENDARVQRNLPGASGPRQVVGDNKALIDALKKKAA